MLPYFTLFFASLIAAQASTATAPVDLNRYPPQPQETTCGWIVNENLYNNQFLYNASDVVDCLTSVPFNSAVAIRFLQYLNETFQFHATTAFIRNPPPGYQQAPFNLFGALQETENKVIAGTYHNQYAFEIDVQKMVRNLHDTHVYIDGGISSPMSFLSPFQFVSVSSDGKQLPQVYIYDDLVQQTTRDDYVASPIAAINGVPATEYLISFAAQQSFGMVDPHADWNQLMASPAQDIFGLNSFSDAAPFYPGNQITLTFQNNSAFSYPWLALYDSPSFTGPLETGGDFYNFFVLGLVPQNYHEEYEAYISSFPPPNITLNAGGSSDRNATRHTSWHYNFPAYPADTMVHQADLGEFTAGALTGYFLSNISTAVLSLPSFQQYGQGVETFSQAVSDFVDNAAERNASKIVIDLQQNDGGLAALAFFVFDKFFPQDAPIAESRMRAQQTANVLGESFTSYFESLRLDLSNEHFMDFAGSEWVVTDRINSLTGGNFTSWTGYYGPTPIDGDDFTLVQQYNLSDPIFVEAAFDVSMSACFYNNSCNVAKIWQAQDIVLLTDGICGSTCSLFVEMMRQQGVKTVTIGGRPEFGPMQAASGSRGAAMYSDDELDYDYLQAGNINDTAAAALPQMPPDTGMSGINVGFTLRDQIQPNFTIPNQVLYMPADCRMFWTFANFHNYQRLWMDVYTAAFRDSSLCVPGSVNASTPIRHIANTTSVSPSAVASIEGRSKNLDEFNEIDAVTAAILQGFGFPEVEDDGSPMQPLQFCDHTKPQSRQCKDVDTACYPVTFACANGCTNGKCLSHKTMGICTQPCMNANSNQCGGYSTCQENSYASTKSQNVAFGESKRITQGYCVPEWSQRSQKQQCSKMNPKALQGMVQNQSQ